MISILTPFYNSERYLKTCIESVLNQTYTDFEFLLLDDGSTDNSVDIVKSYSDDRIKLFHNEKNMGRGYSRNILLDLSNTELSCWCDADDFMLPTKLEKQYNYFKENECFFLATEMYDMRDSIIVGSGCNKYYMINDLTLEKLKVSNCINHPTVMFKTEIAKKLRFKNDMTFNEDWDFYIRLYEIGYNVNCLEEKLYVYKL